MDLNTLFGYEGKTVVVSGAYSGMGRAAAKLLSELGAEVYTICRRNGRHSELDFPVLPPKAGRAKEQRTVFLISDGTRILLGKRPNKGLLAGLCEFPGTDGALRTDEAGQFVRDLGYDVTGIRKLPKAKHIFSHKEWHMTGYAVNVRSLDGAVPADTTARARLSSVELFPATKAEMETRWSIPSAFSAFLPGALADG